MNTIETVEGLRAQVAAWRVAGERVAFVPTMGNLHAGHLALVAQARARAQRVVASIFVNPMQFGPAEDLDAYPRTLARDRELLEAAGCDLLFAPGVATVYPRGSEAQTRVEVPGLSDVLCGESRPGHFRGVATVVCKLFNMVQPDVALFGEKDFQQLLVIRRMVEDLAMPVEIVGVPTVREPDGLAMSSRNGYLSPSERARAPALRRVLTQARESLLAGNAVALVEREAEDALREAGLTPDYIRVCTTDDLRPATESDRDLVILAAAYLGRARLIDNLRVQSDTNAAPQQTLR
ncbi:pantoate--beta-alanine ligase [Thiocapsa marina]|uniref:Pantothenate synthetase n=1 Tax=Thiocapsa marina 5811 TaxID=768671 RepID=F9UAL1_9GAMM|nr:pantoate--beta-alanine ligase [Thiocapsa marina]EGV18763.1 Pantothenate synthetase [Thiocapsa marina 5811]